MLNQPTIEKLHTMKLHGMADAFRAQLETADASQLGFEERFAMLVDQQWLWKENRALARRLQSARLKERGVIEDIDYQHPRGLDRKLMRTLSASEWVRQNQNVLLHRAHRHRQKLAGVRAGAESLPRRILRPAQTDHRTVPRTGRGACGRQHRTVAAEAIPASMSWCSTTSPWRH